MNIQKYRIRKAKATKRKALRIYRKLHHQVNGCMNMDGTKEEKIAILALLTR